ncbi:hypothetical protein [Streptomyces sp. NRRL F-2580]|uniref:hypothetical protein n=1 Tax=Streptomyces sp. NRRL F-2580 TaxID=1463841 RepID=UPI001F3CA00B|nr:hypothetical protein [Streptomyces sp. NRRL F-2580]
MSDDADDPQAAWRRGHECRAAAVSAPYGPLALTGTYRLADYPVGRIPAVAGRWRTTDGGVALTAVAEDGLRLDGEPFTGDAVPAADEAPAARSRLSAGEVRIVVIRREGDWAVRVFDPASQARRAFTGVVATPVRPRFRAAGALQAVHRGPERPGGERRRTGPRTRPRR